MRAVILILTAAACASAQVTINTAAGGGTDDGVAATQSRVQPSSLVASPDGSLYFPGLYSIRRIRPDGILETVAGTGTSGFSGDGGPAVSAQIWYPGNIVRDSAGNLLFPDNFYRMRKIAPGGMISTFAGNGLPPDAAAISGEGMSSSIGPNVIAIDANDNVYFLEVDFYISRVRKISAAGAISLFAGSSASRQQPGDEGDGGPATAAHLTNPAYMTADRQGNLYVSEDFGLDLGAAVRKIDTNGIISTLVGPTVFGPIVNGQNSATAYFQSLSSMATDSAGNLYLTGVDYQGHFGAWQITPDEKIASVPAVTGPILGIDAGSTIYFEYEQVFTYAVKPGQTAVLIAGSTPFSVPDGTQAHGAYLRPMTMTVDSSDRLVFAESGICRIRRVGSGGAIETIAGTGKCATVASAGPALTTEIPATGAMVGTPDGAVSFLGGGSVYRLDTSGQFTVSQRFATGNNTIAADSKSNVYVVSDQTVVRITPAGQVSTFATLSNQYGQPEPPLVLAVDPSDTVYCYSYNGVGYTIDASGHVTSSNGDPAEFALFDRAGHEYQILYFGIVYRDGAAVGQTVGYSGDGGPAQSAYYYQATQLATDSKSAVYILDSDNGVIRRLTGSLPNTAPSITTGGVLDSASYSGSTLAPGEMVTIFGQNLGYDVAVAQPADSRFPSVLGSTQVFTQNQYLPLLAVTPGQVNAILPHVLSGATVTLGVEVDGVGSQSVTLPIADAHPGLFTANASGSGPGSIVNQDGTVNSASNPAARGSVISLYGTGAGAMTPALPYGNDGYLNLSIPFGTIGGSVSAAVGGQPANVLYSGGAPFLVDGVFQMNVAVPSNIPAGSADIAVTIAGSSSNHVTVFVY